MKVINSRKLLIKVPRKEEEEEVCGLAAAHVAVTGL